MNLDNQNTPITLDNQDLVLNLATEVASIMESDLQVSLQKAQEVEQKAKIYQEMRERVLERLQVAPVETPSPSPIVLDEIRQEVVETLKSDLLAGRISPSMLKQKESPDPVFTLLEQMEQEQKKERSEFIAKHMHITQIPPDTKSDKDVDEFVFVSYKSGDWEEVFKKYVVPMQKKYGLNVYSDASFDRENENWTVQMERHITSSKCKAVLCFLSKGYLGSYATLLEIMTNRFNRNYGKGKIFKPFIPIILDDDRSWESHFREEKSLSGGPTTGPEKRLMDELLPRFRIILKHDKETLDEMHRDSIINDIDRMLEDQNYAHRVDKFLTYHFISVILSLSNDPSRNYYSNQAPDTFFQNLYSTIDSAIRGDISNGSNGNQVFSGEKDPHFDVCQFVSMSKEEDFVCYRDTGRLISYRGASSQITLPDYVVSIGTSVFESLNFVKISFNTQITHIETDAFFGCTRLKEITLPESVTTVDSGAFRACAQLEEVTLSSTMTVLSSSLFQGCSRLQSIELPPLVTEIEEKAFLSCSLLSSINLGSTLTKVGKSAFSYCEELSKIVLPPSVTTIEDYAFERCLKLKQVTLSPFITQVPAFCFSGCLELEEIIIPEGVVRIGENAFSNCKKLKSIQFPSTLLSIGSQAFLNCSSLEEITLPNSLKKFGNDAFQNCIELKKIIIPKKVQTLSLGLFAGCTALSTVVLPSDLQSISSFTSQSTENNEDARLFGTFESCYNLHSIEIPTTVTYIGSHCFKDCIELTETGITEESQFTSLATGAFQGCSSLTQITLPAKMTTIDAYGFANCTSLHTVILPQRVETIAHYAFAQCSNLQTLTLPFEIKKMVERYGFYQCNQIDTVLFHQDTSKVLFEYDENNLNHSALISLNSTPWFAQLLKKENSYSLSESGCVLHHSSNKVYIMGYTTPQTEIVIPKEVTLISDRAFAENEILKKVILHQNLSDIGSGAFANCTALEEVVIEKIPLFEEQEKMEKRKEMYKFLGKSSKKKVLRAYTFSGCSSLTHVELDEDIRTVERNAFEGCSSLESFELPPHINFTLAFRLFADCTALKSVILPTEAKILNLPDSMFSGCTNLTEVVLPKTLDTLASGTFRSCSNLKTIALPETIRYIDSNAFANCTGLEEIVFPQKLVRVSNNAFENCTSLKKVEFPATFGLMHAEAFLNCTALEEVVFHETSTNVCHHENEQQFLGCLNLSKVTINIREEPYIVSMFEGTPWLDENLIVTEFGLQIIDNHLINYIGNRPILYIDNTVKTIGRYFIYTRDLVEVILPDSITELSASQFRMDQSKAFQYSYLRRIDLSKTKITTLPKESFFATKHLEEVILPNTLERIESLAFSNCSINRIVIPDSVKYIDAFAFYECTNLSEVVLPDGVTMGQNVFHECYSLSNISVKSTLNYPIGITIVPFGNFEKNSVIRRFFAPSTLRIIGENAFSNCANLEEVNLAEGVTTICPSAFSGCRNLKKLTLPSSLRVIGENAFACCTSLEEVVLPKGLYCLGNTAFSGCETLKKLKVPLDITFIGMNVIRDCPLLEDTVINPSEKIPTKLWKSEDGTLAFTPYMLNCSYDKLLDAPEVQEMREALVATSPYHKNFSS